jgi:hypothetical protein
MGQTINLQRPVAKQMPRSDAPSRSIEELPYLIELWHAEQREEVEVVLARALSLGLARAIFKAATSEYPERRVTLRKDSSIIIADSSVKASQGTSTKQT